MPVFIVGILMSFFILFIFVTGCTATEKISKDEAIRVALNDTRTVQAINNYDYIVSEVSTANIGVGTGSQEEVYYISIKVPGASNKRVNVFVTYDGKVALVDIPYPVITPPLSLLNNSQSVTSEWNATGRNVTEFIPEHVPLETPLQIQSGTTTHWLVNGGNPYLLFYDPAQYGSIYWEYVAPGSTYNNFVYVR